MERYLLHAEDDPGYFKDVASRLRELGIQSVHASSPANAFRLATEPDAALKYFAILVDLDIQPCDHLEIAEQARHMKPIDHALAELIV